MPMIPEAMFAMLACARIGAPHSVVFGGFSSEALNDRLIDGNARFVITAFLSSITLSFLKPPSAVITNLAFPSINLSFKASEETPPKTTD